MGGRGGNDDRSRDSSSSPHNNNTCHEGNWFEITVAQPRNLNSPRRSEDFMAFKNLR